MDQMVAGNMAGGDHGAAAAAVHGDGSGQRGRRREKRCRGTSGSPGSSCRGRRSKGRSAGGDLVLGPAAEKRTESRTIPANAGSPTRFLARGGRRQQCGAGGGVGRSSDGRNRRHGAAAEGGKKWLRPGTRVRVSREARRGGERGEGEQQGGFTYPPGGPRHGAGEDDTATAAAWAAQRRRGGGS